MYLDVKMKDAAKKIGKQFACGSSVSKAPSGVEEVVIQGDVLADLPDFLEATFNVSFSLFFLYVFPFDGVVNFSSFNTG